VTVDLCSVLLAASHSTLEMQRVLETLACVCCCCAAMVAPMQGVLAPPGAPREGSRALPPRQPAAAACMTRRGLSISGADACCIHKVQQCVVAHQAITGTSRSACAAAAPYRCRS
jgi:hypothetical protein